MIDLSYAKELLDYNTDTGILVWKERPIRSGHEHGDHMLNGRNAGKVAGRIDGNGYRSICIDGKIYLAHRIIWFLMTGEFPKHQIDHKNGNRDDNCWENLREATSGENHQNIKKRRDNKSGHIGVCWDKSRQKWKMAFEVDGKVINKRFITYEDACSSYIVLKAQYHNFQPNIREE